MNKTPSLNEINKTANMDPNMITKHYKLKLMNDFVNIKYINLIVKTIRDSISNKHVTFYYSKI